MRMQIRSGGASVPKTTDSNGNDAGNVSAELRNFTFPVQEYDQVDGVASAVVATPIYTSGDVSMYNYHSVEAITSTAKVEATLDGTNWFAVQVILTSTWAASATIGAADCGILEGKFYGVRVKPNAAASTNARIVHSVK